MSEEEDLRSAMIDQMLDGGVGCCYESAADIYDLRLLPLINAYRADRDAVIEAARAWAAKYDKPNRTPSGAEGKAIIRAVRALDAAT